MEKKDTLVTKSSTEEDKKAWPNDACFTTEMGKPGNTLEKFLGTMRKKFVREGKVPQANLEKRDYLTR